MDSEQVRGTLGVDSVRPAEGGAAERAAAAGRLFPATAGQSGGVLLRHADEIELADLAFRAIGRQRPASLPRSTANQAVLDGYVQLLAPHFDTTASANVTLTYSDGYGYAHGLMLARNVVKDVRRVLQHERRGNIPWCIGVERHRTGRDVLHSHSMLGGAWTSLDLERLQAYLVYSRGWAVVKSVSDAGGCVEYCAKHLLKTGAADNFVFHLPASKPLTRHAKRLLGVGVERVNEGPEGRKPGLGTPGESGRRLGTR